MSVSIIVGSPERRSHKVRDAPNKIGDFRLRAGHANGSNNPAIRTSQYLRNHPKSKFHETDFNPTLTMRAELRLILTHHATSNNTLSVPTLASSLTAALRLRKRAVSLQNAGILGSGTNVRCFAPHKRAPSTVTSRTGPAGQSTGSRSRIESITHSIAPSGLTGAEDGPSPRWQCSGPLTAAVWGARAPSGVIKIR